MNKKVVGIVTGVLCLAAAVGIGLGYYFSKANDRVINQGVLGLERLDKYVISTSVKMPDSSLAYIEVNTPYGCYTEYPYTDSEKSNTTEGSKSYKIYDWLTIDNKLYNINTQYTDGKDAKLWLQMPEDYANQLKDRRTMYATELVSSVKKIKKQDTQEMDIGLSEKVGVQLYSASIESDTIKSIMGRDTLGLYKALKSESEKNKDTSVMNLMDIYINKSENELTFSDGEITFGTYDNKLVYYKISCGGLGSTMEVTKLLLLSDIEMRALPDFESSNSSYYDSIKSYADYVDTAGGEEKVKEQLNSK